jgi:predicted NAD/FAD-binding protein
LLWGTPNDLCIQKDLSPGVGYGEEPHRKRLAVVGGGTAGLSFLKVVHELKEQTHLDWEVVLFEQHDDIGGTWCVVISISTLPHAFLTSLP